ncbi:MAG: PH domain-containing protein [Chitinophagaceae bacterium]
MTFKSAIQWGLFIPLIIILIGTGVLIACSGFWWILVLNLLLSVFILQMITATSYRIADGNLYIRCGITFRQTIPVSSVCRISTTTSILSSPAASLRNRLEIKYGKYNSVIISPADGTGFVTAMQAVNPEIEWRDMRGGKRRKR